MIEQPTTQQTVRISRKLFASLPEEVAKAVMRFQHRYPTAKSVKFCTVSPTYKVYGGEGDRFEAYVPVKVGEKVEYVEAGSVEFGADHNVGAAGVSSQIGAGTAIPTGAFLLQVWYGYEEGYKLTIYNGAEAQLAAPQEA